MIVHRPKQMFLVSFAVGLIFILGCEMVQTPSRTKQVRTGPRRYYVFLRIYSDPPGAHVYLDSGLTSLTGYQGQTGEHTPVDVMAAFDQSLVEDTRRQSGVWLDAVVTLKKRGYKSTKYRWSMRRSYNSEEEARRNPQKVVVVLGLE